MKPCSKNRKQIVWLMLGELDAGEASALREHLAHCDGCRRYGDEISSVMKGLASAKPDSDLEASELFHRKVAEKLQAVESGSTWENLTAFIRGTLPNWRVALPVTAALVIAVFALITLRQSPPPASPVPPAVPVASTAGSESDLPPTLANYQMIAGQSLRKLDEVLNAQGNKALPPAPIYTASTFRLANSPF